jgi:hypothetical protein
VPAWLTGALRAALQAGWAWLAAWVLARFGLQLPEHEPAWVDAAAAAAVMAAIVGAVQWAERRPDTTLTGRALRWLARVAMAGLRPATYPQPSTT